MRFPLTEHLLAEAARYQLRSACGHCAYFVATDRRCAHGWPNALQRRWPLEAHSLAEAPAAEAQFCKEFELR